MIVQVLSSLIQLELSNQVNSHCHRTDPSMSHPAMYCYFTVAPSADQFRNDVVLKVTVVYLSTRTCFCTRIESENSASLKFTSELLRHRNTHYELYYVNLLVIMLCMWNNDNFNLALYFSSTAGDNLNTCTTLNFTLICVHFCIVFYNFEKIFLICRSTYVN